MTVKSLIVVLCSFVAVITKGQDVNSIKNIYKATNQVISLNKCKVVYLTKADSLWEICDSIKKDSVERTSIFETASVFINSKRILKIILTLETPSGDWRTSIEYYFYPKGSTAFIFQKLETYQAYDVERDLPSGPYILEKRIYFDEQANIIKKLQKAYVASTKETIRIGAVHDIEPELYKNIESFPFFPTLEKFLQ